MTDLPCYINEDTVKNSKRLLWQFWNRVERLPKYKALEFAARWDAGILQIIAPLHNFATAANGRIGKKHALKKHDQFTQNTSYFWRSTRSNITTVVISRIFDNIKIMNKLIYYYC